MKNQELAKFGVNTLLELGAQKAECSYSDSQKHELSINSGKISLLRSNFSSDLLMKCQKDHKEGMISLNKIDSESVQNAAREVINIMNASPEDLAKDIAPASPPAKFSWGRRDPDLELMHKRMMEFNDDVKKRYPKVILEESAIDFTHTNFYFMNSNGVDFEIIKGTYSFWAMFTSKDGKKTSSFNYEGFSLKNLDERLIDCGMIDTLLRQSEEQTNQQLIHEKFEGDLIITPMCLEQMLESYLSYLQDGEMILGTSIFKDKLNTITASSKFNLHAKPSDDDFADRTFVTHDGFKSEDLTIFKNGELRSFLISLYGARKTGKARAKNYGTNLIIDTGDIPFEEMVKTVKKGVLLSRISAGMPASNGDFSGVAKNSYYIEDGKIMYPIQETMITGNVVDIFKNINNISSEYINYGASKMPWLHTSGFTISGK